MIHKDMITQHLYIFFRQEKLRGVNKDQARFHAEERLKDALEEAWTPGIYEL